MGREVPEQSYFPGCKVRLIIRFEEFGQKTSIPKPVKRPTMRKGGEEPKPSTTKPQDVTSSSDDLTHVMVGIIPKSARLGRNGIREAASLSFEIKYTDFPLDPRTVRACAVECYMGTVSAEDFAKGINGATRSVSDSGSTYSEPCHMVPDNFTGPRGEQRSNLRFQGWADNIRMVLGEDEPMLSFECTDNTRLLIGQEAPSQLIIEEGIPIDEAFRKYMENFPQFAGIGCVYLPDGETAPDIGQSFGPTKGKTTKKGQGHAPAGETQQSVWDYLTDCARMAGLSIRMYGTDVIIQQVRALLKEGMDHREDDPFRGGRKLPSGDVITRRRFIYGENLKSLETQRNFTKLAPTNVELRCYDVTRKQVLVARHPLNADRQTRASTGDKGDQVWKVYPVHGVADEITLQRIAQEVYEQLCRGELEVRCVTENLASYGGGNDDPDVLDLMPGDSIDAGIKREPATQQHVTTSDLEDELAVENSAVEYLLEQGLDERFARAYAKAFVNVGLTSTYHLRKLGVEWSTEDGYTISLECVNYVVVRADKDSLPAVEPKKSSKKSPDPSPVQAEDTEGESEAGTE